MCVMCVIMKRLGPFSYRLMWVESMLYNFIEDRISILINLYQNIILVDRKSYSDIIKIFSDLWFP